MRKHIVIYGMKKYKILKNIIYISRKRRIGYEGIY